MNAPRGGKQHARVVDALTRTGTLVGTAGYMAPEQARGERWVDGRADLFLKGELSWSWE